MKKVMSLILALVMVFSLCACGGTATKETSGTTNQTPNETTEQNNATEEREDTINLVGTWKDDKTEIIINEDGTGHFKDETRDFDATWEVNDNILKVEFDGGWIPWEIVTENGVTTLKCEKQADWILTLE